MSRWKTLKLSDCLDKSPKTSKIPKKKFLNSGKFPIVFQEKDLVNGYWNDERDIVKVHEPLVVFTTEAVKEAAA